MAGGAPARLNPTAIRHAVLRPLVNQLKPLVDAAKSRQHLAGRCRSSLGRCKGQPGELPLGNALGKVLDTISGPSPTPKRTCHQMVDAIGEVFEHQKRLRWLSLCMADVQCKGWMIAYQG